MKLEFSSYVNSLVSHPSFRRVSSVLLQHRKVTAFATAILASMAAYYFINRRPSDPKTDITPQIKKDEGNPRPIQTNPETRTVLSDVLHPDPPSNVFAPVHNRIFSVNVELLIQFPPPFSPQFSVENRSRALICYQYAPLVVLAPILAQRREGLISLIESIQQKFQPSPNVQPLDQQPSLTEASALVPAEEPPSTLHFVKEAAKNLFDNVENGIDLTPYLLKTMQAGIDFWNAPSQPYDPFTSNLMVGFARKFGVSLHFLLLNTSRFKGPEFTGQLVMKLQGVEKVGMKVANNMLKFCNPLGWGSLVLQLVNLGVNTADFMGTGILEQLELQIDQWLLDFVKKLKIYTELDLEYFEKKKQQEQAEEVFNQEILLYKAWLIAHGKNSTNVIEQRYRIYRYTLGIMVDWHIDCLTMEGFEPAPSYFEAEKAKELAEKAFTDVQWRWFKDAKQKHELAMKRRYDQSQPEPSIQGKPDDTIFTTVLPTLSQFFKRTTKKTLTSLLDVIGEKVDSSEFSASHKDRAKASLKTLVFGNASLRERDYKKAAQTVGMLSQVSNWISNPASAVARFVPAELKTRVKPLTAPLNRGIGMAVGTVATSLRLDEIAINQLQLQKLDELFPERDLKLDVSQLLPNSFKEGLMGDVADALIRGLIRRMQRKINNNITTRVDFDYTQTLQRLIQQMGEQIADRLSYLLAVYLKETCQVNYSPEELMTKRVGGWFS